MDRPETRHSERWLPGLYIADALPYVVLNILCVLMYKRLGVQNVDITFFTSLFYLPLIVEPLLFPFLRMMKGSRKGLVCIQALICFTVFALAFSITSRYFFAWSLLWLGIMSALAILHGIAANNYYGTSILPSVAPVLIRLRSFSFRFVLILAQGTFIIMAGVMEVYTRNVPKAWTNTLLAFGVLLAVVTLSHLCWQPRVVRPKVSVSGRVVRQESWQAFRQFFTQPHLCSILCFLFFFRMTESFLWKIGPLFMIDPAVKGGADLSLQEVGLTLGTLAPLGVFVGFAAGRWMLDRFVMKRCFLPLTFAFFLQGVAYWSISEFSIRGLMAVSSLVWFGELCKGMGLALFFRFFTRCICRRHKVMSSAICMSVMSLGLCVCTILSGQLQEIFGYAKYFRFILLLGILPMLLSWYILTNDNLLDAKEKD